ncbi:MAG: lysophospholipid acyltransferase family protein [Burkholderiales bacterium]|nr:lysophospholipid acyltransferase family protein [Burkholderiales bacterium]MDE2077575.1 lysophospholipid acyltransferase family protein [Burkholderiales bacterium]
MARLFFMLASWPLGLLHWIGAMLGWLVYALSPTYRKRFRRHAKAAGLSLWQRWSAVAHNGRMVAELPRLWGRPQGALLGKRVQWRHPEHIEQALAEGKGLILLTPHVGCFEINAQAYAERFGHTHPMTALYRPAKQAWLAEVMAHARNRPGLQTAPATLSGVRAMLRALKNGQCVGLLPDQVPPEGMGVWVPFFGRDAYTMTMAGKLAQQTGAKVILMRGERLSGWQRLRQHCDYVVHVEPGPIDLDQALASGDPAQSAAAINRAMEHLIMQSPEQYLWGYNRYKGPRAEILTTADAKPGASA